MAGAGVIEVGAGDADLQPLDAAVGAPQRVEVQQGLSGVLPLPEAAVDDRRLTGTDRPAGLDVVEVA